MSLGRKRRALTTPIWNGCGPGAMYFPEYCDCRRLASRETNPSGRLKMRNRSRGGVFRAVSLRVAPQWLNRLPGERWRIALKRWLPSMAKTALP